MLPSYYEYHNPVKILSGKKACDNIPNELETLGANRPLIITDKGVVKAGLLDILKKSLKSSKVIIGAIYDNTPPDSSNHVVDEIAKIYFAKKCDSIIAIGGGSPIDTAKAVNILATEESDDLLKFSGVNRLKKQLKPLVVIPTTSGTGSEATTIAVIANPEKNIKMPFQSMRLYPSVAVLDPRMTQTMPPHITAATGMDALTHAVEAYSCLQKNPMSDAYATKALDLIRENLIKAVKKGRDLDARMAMANASLMAGTAFSNSMVGIVHGIGHACGAISHVPHGIAMGLLLPFGMEFNLPEVSNYYSELLLHLGGAEEFAKTPGFRKALRSIEIVRQLNQKLNELGGMPITLKQAGVKKEDLGRIAETALNDGAMLPNPIEVKINDIHAILKEAYDF